MKAIPFDVGKVVLSKQGHDKGRFFVVVGVQDARHVLIADGETRRLEKPKKKQTKHLRLLPMVLADIAEALEAGKPVQDNDLRKGLRAAVNAEQAEDQGEKRPCQQKEECALVQE